MLFTVRTTRRPGSQFINYAAVDISCDQHSEAGMSEQASTATVGLSVELRPTITITNAYQPDCGAAKP